MQRLAGPRSVHGRHSEPVGLPRAEAIHGELRVWDEALAAGLPANSWDFPLHLVAQDVLAAVTQRLVPGQGDGVAALTQDFRCLGWLGECWGHNTGAVMCDVSRDTPS